MNAVIDTGRAKRLKAATDDTHERLDKRIMGADPFGNRERYGRFLWVQHRFHHDIDALYGDPALAAAVPDLENRRRLLQIEQDIADLGQVVPRGGEAVFGAGGIDTATAFGWLYVAEGSNLGAAFLFKAAAALGLGADYGARHLAGHPEGRARHWREFTAALDALALSSAAEARLIAAAKAAFVRVHTLVGTAFS